MSLINAGSVLGGREAADVQAQIAAKLNTTDAPATVRGTALTGLSTATAAPVTAADTVLTAAGKLQRQTTNNFALLPRRYGVNWYLTDRWYTPTYPFAAKQMTFTSPDGLITYVDFPSLESATFKSIGVNVTNAAAGSQIYLGVFTSDGNGEPATLLFASAALDGTTTGEKIATISGGLNVSQGQRLIVAILSIGAAITVSGFEAYNAQILKTSTTASGINTIRRYLYSSTMQSTTSSSTDRPLQLPEIRLQAA